MQQDMVVANAFQVKDVHKIMRMKTRNFHASVHNGNDSWDVPNMK